MVPLSMWPLRNVLWCLAFSKPRVILLIILNRAWFLSEMVTGGMVVFSPDVVALAICWLVVGWMLLFDVDGVGRIRWVEEVGVCSSIESWSLFVVVRRLLLYGLCSF